MEWHKWAALTFGSLFIALATNAYAVTIHDVYVMGQAVPGAPVSGPNCVEFSIGTVDGTDYGDLIIQGRDGINPATIRAIENNATCYGTTVNATRDRLFGLVNARIIPKATGVNIDLVIEYRADFGPTPNGSVVFGGSMKGIFRKNNVGVTCTGNSPPNGPCKVIYHTGVVSFVTGSESPLPEISTTNPLSGNFNVTIPASTAVNVGTLGRGFHAIVTTKLPTIDHTLEITSADIVLQAHP